MSGMGRQLVTILTCSLACTIITKPVHGAEKPNKSAGTAISGYWHFSILALSKQKPENNVRNFSLKIAATPKGKLRVTLARLGPRPAADTVTISPPTAPEAHEDIPQARHVAVTVNLSEGKQKLPIRFELRFAGSEVSGYWEYRGAAHMTRKGSEPAQSLVSGVLLGRRGGSAAVALSRSTPIPCVTCCNVLARCGSQGPGSCNGSLTCLSGCIEPQDGKKPNQREKCLQP